MTMVLAHNIEEGLRTRDVQISQDVTFDTMLLAANTLQGLTDSGFYKPSPIQLHGIPLGKCGFDLLLEAKSGTGKTAVFSVIALEKLDINKGLQAVILAPTREIAFQICDVIKQIGRQYRGLVVEVVMGGLPVAEDVEKFKKNVHIVVGSPGRLRHLIQDKHINISSVRLLVLDEADKLMEKSFLTDINYIFSILPDQKQVIMSSATYPECTRTFINRYVKCAQHVCPDSNCILLGVEQKITVVKCNANIVRQTQFRFVELLQILSQKQFKQCLIFCNYQARVNELYKLLTREKWPVEQLCGQQEQSDRLDALKTLQEYKCRILISTDLAARGIDASNVDLVINFEPPFEWQTYLHRIGRAGRYGSYGMAITILSEGKEEKDLKKILNLINLDELKVTNFWTFQEFDENVQESPRSGEVPSNTFDVDTFAAEYKEFWKTLVSDGVIVKEIDAFEELCKSFEKYNLPVIETFTDLMHSYKTGINIDNCHSTYQCINIQSTTNKHFITDMKCLETKNECVNGVNIKPYKHAIKDNNDNDMSTAADSFKQIQLEDNTNIIKHEKICISNNINYDFYSNINCDKTETDSTNRALMDAGLPLSFGYSKNNRPGKGKVKVTKENKQKNGTSKILQNNNIQNHISNEIRINHKDTCQYEPEVNHISFQNETNYGNKRKVHNRTKATSYSKAEISSVRYTYSQDYINWYKQLRSRVKYFELTVYLDEISKL